MIHFDDQFVGQTLIRFHSDVKFRANDVQRIAVGCIFFVRVAA